MSATSDIVRQGSRRFPGLDFHSFRTWGSGISPSTGTATGGRQSSAGSGGHDHGSAVVGGADGAPDGAAGAADVIGGVGGDYRAAYDAAASLGMSKRIRITLQEPGQRMGISLVNMGRKQGQCIGNVAAGSPAARAGVLPGLYVHAVGASSTIDRTHTEVVAMLNGSGKCDDGVVELLVGMPMAYPDEHDGPVLT